jgi:hypothetical protein
VVINFIKTFNKVQFVFNQNGCEEGTFGTATRLKPGRNIFFGISTCVSSKLKCRREVDGVSGVIGALATSSSSAIEFLFLVDLGVTIGAAK